MYESQENVQAYASLSIPSARAEQASSARFVFMAKQALRGGFLSGVLARRYQRVPIFIGFFISTLISSFWRWVSSLHVCICALRGKSTRSFQHAQVESHRHFVVDARV